MNHSEQRIYESIDDRVFIRDFQDDFLDRVRAQWQGKVVSDFAQIPVFPFKKEDLISITDVSIRLERETDNGAVKVDVWDNAFQPTEENNRTNPLRIVVSGEPAIGKTTLLKKLLYHHTTRDCQKLDSYDLVLHLDLADAPIEKPYTRIADCLLNQCLGNDSTVSADEIENFIQVRNGRGILFLLDNFHDVPDCEEMSEIYDVIKSHLWPECGLIVTTNDNGYPSKMDSVPFNQWKRYRLPGFRCHDIVEKVKNIFRDEDLKLCDDVTISRHVTNLLRVYQRDVYVGLEASPVFASVMCYAWKKRYQACLRNKRSNELVKSLFTDSMTDIMDIIFSR